jgi:hypothetical protein
MERHVANREQVFLERRKGFSVYLPWAMIDACDVTYDVILPQLASLGIIFENSLPR